MKNNILITVPNLVEQGGVSAFWNSLFEAFKKFNDINFNILQIGGHGINVFGPIVDQWHFKRAIGSKVDLAFLNPSLGSRSFFRDALFAKQTIKKDIPFVVFFHGWDLDFEKKVDKKYVDFFLKTFGQAKKIFVLSQDFKEKILEWGYRGEVIIETTNVDSSLLADFTLEKKLSDLKTVKKIKILFLARLLREKGVFETVAAFKKLSEKQDNIELTIAGDGTDLNELKELVKDDKNIVVAGYVEGQSKIDLLQGSHIYCLPSYSEGLPTSVLEAMAFGLSVITTNVGGLKEFFQDGKMGYFVEGENVEDIEGKLLLLIENEQKREEIARYNYSYAQENLLNTVVAERIYKHLKDELK